MRGRRPAALCVALAALTGCATVRPPAAPSRVVQPLPAEIAQYYSYPERPHDVTKTLTREHRRWREFLVRFPLSAQGFEPTEPVVEFEWFESTRPGKRPGIAFHPILGGDYPLERGICRYFAKHGFHVAMIHRKTLKISPEHEPERLEVLLRQGVIRIRQVLDWMEEQPNVDATRLAGYGISMGGIATVIAAAVDPRLRCHVAALPGGSIADILATSHDPLLIKPMRRYLERRHMTKAELDAVLRRVVKTDPVLLAPYVDASHLLLFIALADRTIGRANALRLRAALGRPETVFMPFGHYTSYLALPYMKRRSRLFLQRCLAPEK